MATNIACRAAHAQSHNNKLAILQNELVIRGYDTTGTFVNIKHMNEWIHCWSENILCFGLNMELF